MKKIICLLLLCALAISLFACTNGKDSTQESTNPSVTTKPNGVDDPTVKGEGVMTWEEYVAAELESEVVVEAYIQGKQAWWYNSDKNTGLGTFYLQDAVGGYFLYELPCTEEEYNALTVGTKVRVTGYKTEWSGEVEIIDATYEVLEGNYIATPKDVTNLLGNDELINYQNMLVVFKGLTVVSTSYKNGERGNDIYVTLSYNGTNYDFCVESYLTDADTAVYAAVEALEAGDVIDVTGFAYWYNGINTHITGVQAHAE